MAFMLRKLVHAATLGALASSAFALAGCGNGSSGGTGGGSSNGSDFVSDRPGSNGGLNAGDGSGEGTGSGGGSGAEAPGQDDAGRAIEEADIIQVKDDRLYALSQYSGLSIIDISNASKLKVVGRHPISGMPFEMYLRDGVVYAMFSSWWQSIYDDDAQSWSWVQSSHIEALNVQNPANITSLGKFDLPGTIADSRVVGDVLYAVTWEDGYCWNCQAQPNTTITSLTVGDPAEIGVVDQLTYTSPTQDEYGWWRRSVAATSDRLYVAGVEWDGAGEGHSTIQIVDISDPGGALVQGASVEAAGQIESRWQMDEHEGVLRVISQPGVWWSNGVPQVQTFQVVSSQQVTPLATVDLTLPKPERLRSVRFDGTRAYAITAEQTDPLFTIDLSNPAEPQQMGQLEMPGWIYHMEPRGDRLFALGFDNSDPGGSLNVSLFDVSDLANPTMLKRVAFGGDWSDVPEDQDRIHKAFKIDADLGAVFIPYYAYTYDKGYGCGSSKSGVQIVDFTNDTLTKRGTAPSQGWARRAFVHDDKLFAVSDNDVRSYDITDRDTPAALGSLALSANVSRTVVAGNVVVRLAADWWTTEARLEVVPKNNPAQAERLGSIDLAQVFGNATCGLGYWNTQLFANGSLVYLVADTGYWDGSGSGEQVAVFDVSNPSAPTLKGSTTVPFGGLGDYWWGGGVVASGSSLVQVGGDTLVFRWVDYSYDSNSLEKAWLEVIDLSDPTKPKHAASYKLPDGYGHTPLLVDGTTVLTSHWAPLPNDANKVKFFIDRVSVANPAQPTALAPVNVPGSLVAFDHDSAHALTVDYQKVQMPAMKAEDCFQQFGGDASWDGAPGAQFGTCTAMKRTLKVVGIQGAQASLLDSKAVPDGMYLDRLMVGDDRVFAFANPYYGYWEDGSGVAENGPQMLVVSGIAAGELVTAKHVFDAMDYEYPVAAAGTRVVLAGYSPPSIASLDAADMDNLVYLPEAEVTSYVYSVTLDGDRALCSMGPYGLEVVELGD